MSTNLAGELEVLDQVMLSSRQLKYGLRKCKSKQGVTLDTWYIDFQNKPPRTLNNSD